MENHPSKRDIAMKSEMFTENSTSKNDHSSQRQGSRRNIKHLSLVSEDKAQTRLDREQSLGP